MWRLGVPGEAVRATRKASRNVPFQFRDLPVFLLRCAALHDRGKGREFLVRVHFLKQTSSGIRGSRKYSPGTQRAIRSESLSARLTLRQEVISEGYLQYSPTRLPTIIIWSSLQKLGRTFQAPYRCTKTHSEFPARGAPSAYRFAARNLRCERLTSFQARKQSNIVPRKRSTSLCVPLVQGARVRGNTENSSRLRNSRRYSKYQVHWKRLVKVSAEVCAIQRPAKPIPTVFGTACWYKHCFIPLCGLLHVVCRDGTMHIQLGTHS